LRRRLVASPSSSKSSPRSNNASLFVAVAARSGMLLVIDNPGAAPDDGDAAMPASDGSLD